jgi:hypothetical protein
MRSFDDDYGKLDVDAAGNRKRRELNSSISLLEDFKHG